MCADAHDSCNGCAVLDIFFYSSRRRHTRWPRDWSSDVCSSDLCPARRGPRARGRGPRRAGHDDGRLHRRGRPRGGGLRSRPHHRLAARRRRSDRVNSLTVDATAQGAAPGVGGGGTDSPPPPTTPESRWNRTVHKIIRGNVLVVVMSFVFAFLIGSLLIVIADAGVRGAAGYFFDQPSDTLIAVWQSISGAYTAMFRGAVFDGAGFSRAAEAVRDSGGSGTYVLMPALRSEERR